MLLSAIGIFMVVDHHTFTAFNLLGDYIPYNSFFMPMFVFISGYFNKVDNTTDIWAYTKKKIKNLLLPYLGISLFVFAVQQLIDLLKTGEGPSLPSGYMLYVLERVITVGSPFPMAAPIWFVISLFTLLITYMLIKKLLYKIWNSYVMFGLSCVLSMLVVLLTHIAGPDSFYWFLLPLKCLFFLPFLELGIIYREHLEKPHTGLSGGLKTALLFALLLINVVRTTILPSSYDVAFDSLDDLSGFTSPYIFTPLISAFTGILFWLTVVDLIGKPLAESRFINFMSCNTFWIMGLHILFFNILNIGLLAVNDHITALPYFDSQAFRESEWYYWEINSNFKAVYVIMGILGPLGLKWLFDKMITMLRSKLSKRLYSGK